MPVFCLVVFEMTVFCLVVFYMTVFCLVVFIWLCFVWLQHDGWIHQYWFVVLLIVLAIVALVMFITFFIIIRRKKWVVFFHLTDWKVLWMSKQSWQQFLFFCSFDLHGLIVKETCWLRKIDLYCRSLEELENKANVARTSSTGVTESQNAQSFENSLYFEMNQQKKDNNSKVNFKAMPWVTK